MASVDPHSPSEGGERGEGRGAEEGERRQREGQGGALLAIS